MRYLIVLFVIVYVLVMTTMTHAQKIPFSFISGTIIPSAIPTMAGDTTGPIQANVNAQLQGYPVSTVTPVNGQMMGAIGGKWAPVATPTSGPTPEASPTAISALPTCDPTHLGLRGRITDQDCPAVTYAATPLATAGTGCNVGVYCGGAPTGTPTPSWKLD